MKQLILWTCYGFSLLLWPINTYSQSLRTIEGVVSDSYGKPISGVLVELKGTETTASTDLLGRFSISGAEDSDLLFSHPNYLNEEVESKSSNNLNVRLLDKKTKLTEIPVLSGTRTSENMVQAVSSVNGNSLLSSSGSQIIGRLAGRLAGLNVSFNSGAIGFDNTGLGFNIRGITGDGNNTNKVTVLIDGVERSYTSIDPDQIESITILKDALSTILMGQRSSNGVISIITKKGKAGAPRFSFKTYGGFKNPTALPDVLPAWQYAILKNEASLNSGGNRIFSDAQIEAYRNGENPYDYPNVDWYDELLRGYGTNQGANFNVQGGGKGFNYFVDLDYLREDGMFNTVSNSNFSTNEQLNRFIIRTNVGADVTPTTHLQVNLFGRSMRYNEPSGGTSQILTGLLNTANNAYPMLNPDGSLAGNELYQDNLWGLLNYRGHRFTDVKDLAADIALTQKLDFLTNGLYLRAMGSYNNSTNYVTTRAMGFAVYQYYTALDSYYKWGKDTNQTSEGKASSRFRTTYFKGELGYDHSFGKHNVSGLFMVDRIEYLKFQDVQLPMQQLTYALSANYNYDNRYLLEVAGSRSRNNWFAPDKRWGNYGAIGLSWNIHNEKFMEGLDFISMLKPRATYGITGKSNPTYAGYIQTYTLENDNRGDWYPFYGETGKGTFQNDLMSASLVPEKAKKLNIGLDFGFFDNRLTISGDYYYNRYSDLKMTPVYTSSLLGTKSPEINAKKVDYWGGELVVAWQDHIKNFNYYITGNLNFTQSEVAYTQELYSDYEWQLETGKSVSSYRGYVADGLFRSQQEIDDCTAVLSNVPKSELRPGDIRYKDLNGDNVIDVNDQTLLGNNKAKGYWGLAMGFNYKNIDFSALFQGTINRESYMSGNFMYGFANNGNYNVYAYHLNRFTEATANTATQPRLWLGTNTNNTQTSTFWLKNSDFTRLKNIEIGYTLPSSWTRKIHLPTIRLFANGENLLTFSEIFDVRKDIDPESWGSSYPMMRSFTFGFELKF